MSCVDTAPKARLLTLDDLDKRTQAYREFKRARDAVTADLGGDDRLTEAQRQIVESGCLLSAMLKDLGVRWLAGAAVDPTHAATLSNAMRRMFEAAGLKRWREVATPAPLIVNMSEDDQAQLRCREPEPAPESAARVSDLLGVTDTEPQQPAETACVTLPVTEEPPKPGDNVTIGCIDLACVSIEGDGRDKWALFGPTGTLLEYHFCRDAARDRARILSERLK